MTSPPSRLARLQQVLVLTALTLALGWAWVFRGSGSLWVLGGMALILFGYTLFLALEFVLVAWLHRNDPAPRASAPQLLSAWWQETRVAPLVFAWRQPFRWRSLPDTGAAANAGELPVLVLVHGFVCNRGFWLPWMERLRARGQAYVSVNLEPVFGSIDDYVPLIEDAVARAEGAGGPPPVLVCHSMGGLAARAWLAAQPSNGQRVSRVITIGSPHQGTWLGQFSHVPNGRQMRVGGEWLSRLQQREREQRPEQTYARFVCWYSSADNIVFPASTGTLEGADNRFLPATPHVAMAFHPTVIGESLSMCSPAAISPADRTAS
ncbi:MAG TPA: alpha/beta fold hydrolase [Hydrogenophaga sp.]|uniref:esterase/lipase family protein n=1 Tax=Hydrogenophaga sp. TaxID=1904254 RepID=UPI002D164177|nr:alpha/beta fold hydrolase [Hydrogenophaga sp.]HMN92205.1 alpha/beta fold hydrolase [Hydrogenophaga sp.]HMP11593.1 alpha/beta fold hydrolase [Hydrogenophaga sp.]